MLSEIQIAIIVDVESALSTGNLQGNVYLVDNNGPQGSTLEGEAELNTTVYPGQNINWWVTGVDPSTTVSINGFTSYYQPPAIPTIIPQPTNDGSGSWSAEVTTTVAPTSPATAYQYSVVLLFEGGKTMSFDPFLVLTTNPD